MKKKVMLFSATMFLSACVSNPDIGQLSFEERTKLANLEIYQNTTPHNSFEVLGVVKGLSCYQDRSRSQLLSEDEAMQGLKLKAAQMGADAVINTFCQHKSGTDWTNNCWSSFVCAGDAIRYK